MSNDIENSAGSVNESLALRAAIWLGCAAVFAGGACTLYLAGQIPKHRQYFVDIGAELPRLTAGLIDCPWVVALAVPLVVTLLTVVFSFTTPLLVQRLWRLFVGAVLVWLVVGYYYLALNLPLNGIIGFS